MADMRKKTSPARVSAAVALYRRPAVYLIVSGIIALALRLPLVSQSLWYDEIYTLLHYIRGPWSNMFDQYSPNNHPLYTILARLAVFVAEISEATLRLPSVLAGAVLGLVLAWPILRKSPALAVALALVAMLQPWLVVFSGEARGYALMLLLCVIATNVLPTEGRGISWGYVLAVAAAVFTVPIAVIVCLGHGVAIAWLRRGAFKAWLISAVLAGLLTLTLYTPLLSGMVAYFRHPQKPSIGYRQYLYQLCPHLLNGWNASPGLWLPTGAAVMGLTVAVLVGGGIIAWRRGIMKIELVTFAIASGIAIVLPLVLPPAGEVRFVVWLIPLYIVALASILAASTDKIAPAPKAAAAGLMVVGVAVLGLHGWALGRLWAIPPQPVHEALSAADQLAGEGGAIVGIYMCAADARAIYPPRADMKVAYTVEQLQTVEDQASGKLWAVIFYESFLTRDQKKLAEYMQANYRFQCRYPGRISPAALYYRVLPKHIR